MTREERIEHQRAMARIDRQIAELYVRRAKLQDELADDKVDATTGKPPQRRPVPTLVQTPPLSDLDMARAHRALQAREDRRRVKR